MKQKTTSKRIAKPTQPDQPRSETREIAPFNVQRFWVVARDARTLTATVRHDNPAEAAAEAERLAMREGGTFLVLECAGAILRRELAQTATMIEPVVSNEAGFGAGGEDIPF